MFSLFHLLGPQQCLTSLLIWVQGVGTEFQREYGWSSANLIFLYKLDRRLLGNFFEVIMAVLLKM